MMENQSFDDLIDDFKNAPRLGKAEDVPEGSRYIQISDTLLNKLIKKLEEVKNEQKK